jgi:hypothetical protein
VLKGGVDRGLIAVGCDGPDLDVVVGAVLEEAVGHRVRRCLTVEPHERFVSVVGVLCHLHKYRLCVRGGPPL